MQSYSDSLVILKAKLDAATELAATARAVLSAIKWVPGMPPDATAMLGDLQKALDACNGVP